ncbi:hypothetical protein [Variovorax sp. LjRoot175]|uniref:hypothetical protein n=1 Tax=Variovorax sp. LjRoot175 TaxID=3342276 RepID=UPI003F51568D
MKGSNRLLAKCSSLQRATKAGVTCQLPPENDAALVEGGIKVKPGAPALNTLMHRISVLSMAHHLPSSPTPAPTPRSKRSWPRLTRSLR